MVLLFLMGSVWAMADGPGNETEELRPLPEPPAVVQGLEGATNTFYGLYAGANTTDESPNNTFFGANAGPKNQFGNCNSFAGYKSGYSNYTGNYNTFLGYNSGYSNYSGFGNTFLGQSAGKMNTSGRLNTFAGSCSGYSNTTGICNSFLGAYSGYSNSGANASYNTFVGGYSGYDNIDGYDNTFVGYNAGTFNTTGYKNTFVGKNAGLNNTSGFQNTYIGYGAGYTNTEGSRNVFLGHKAGYYETGSDKLYIGNSHPNSPLIYGDFATGKLKVASSLGIGRDPGYPLHMVSGAYCSTGGVWTNASSRTLKENIRALSIKEALDALNNLRPVKYNYKADKSDRHVGFIAEDVPELVATADRKGMSPMDVTAVLTKIAQEDKRIIREQENMIREQGEIIRVQQQMIADIRERMLKIEKVGRK